AAAQQLEKLADVKQCCHRVDALEKAVNSLKENLQRYPGPEELSQCVTLDFVESVLKDMKPQKVRRWGLVFEENLKEKPAVW
ncbi:hypothetical protein ILYODFUR_038018, partial [Ilyodon furcidens]